MVRLLTAILLSAAVAPASWALPGSAPGPDRPLAPPAVPAAAPAAAVDAAPSDALPTSDTLDQALPPLPPLPDGKSTVIGGLVGAVDPVQDILTLDVYGGHAMKIYFDGRTHFYRDGVQTPLADLRAEDRASVETVLDGTDVYALSVHMLTHTPQGECQGQILGYDPNKGILTVRNSLSGIPIRLRVEATTRIAREGQPAFMSQGEGLGDLRTGALASIQFEPDNQGSGIANHISILAIPGSNFEFSGQVTFLDMHTAEIALLDPRDGNNYTIYFSPALFPQAQGLHSGSNVRVTASFNGQHYVANSMTVQ
jgi:hypothetical protein